MSAITPVTIKSGLAGGKRIHGAQVLDTAIFVNGYDDNQAYSIRANTV